MTMMKRWCMVLILLAGLGMLAGCGHAEKEFGESGTAYTAVDSEGTEVRIPKKPKRIITGNLSHDTIVAGLVPAKYLVVINSLSREPKSSFIASEVQHMSAFTVNSMELPVEMVVRTKPELIILTDHADRNTVDMLRGMGYPVVICKAPNSIEEVRDAIGVISAALGEKEKGEKLVAAMDEQLRRADEVLAALPTPEPLALLVSQMQSYGGPGSIYHSLITRARVRNAIAEAGLKNGEPLSKEAILQTNPDCFIVSDYGALSRGRAAEFQKEFVSDPSLQSVKGIHHLVPVPNRYIYCSNQNAGQAVMGLANAVYGPLFDLRDEKNISFAEEE